ncbi:MAG: PEP/pyruvate-binding domain-containing protein, partial [Actinomycetes bacterium]
MAGADGTEGAPHLAGHEPLVLDLGQVRAADVPLVGGKAANLGELVGAGIPVPTGFCVTTAGYDSIASREGLDAVLTALSATSPSDGPALAALAERARSAVARAPVPAQVADAVRAAYDALGPRRPVAVRSSATAEDLPFASFAGQQDTYLNVVGADEVLDAVRRCWASLWTERAVSYRAAQRIDPRSVRLAVVVQ